MIKAVIEEGLQSCTEPRSYEEGYVDADGNLVRYYEVQAPNYDDIRPPISQQEF
ncbi:hypothetical protein [Archaeoglobus fulgidus]|uniref:Uncharacterized protein AF_0898 n=1 Tax=Archaeoglobus fulgidus (strain ATCC 49558 / DSM 4304 / JCM 9628 / NBRC 100126 / VC-16) TaxID=224325 RepID=Y898_ARCFU|nr:hypothetical protein [Archaeoglobus fulgidus]O29364.1 RecName: Full=Uncharacterized protein AF_0898 [Archaeoglobus fulgidus DSM 4304]AAB90356.1 predicted coding region AF_0898 [Archaeoglobus fulgidus DSM 4304]